MDAVSVEDLTSSVEPLPLANAESRLPELEATLEDHCAPLGLNPQASKDSVRQSLKASTIDGVFAAIFSNIAGGVLLSNFLVELDATPVEIGMLASIPMVANLIQPLGAYLGDRTNSRHWYCFWIYVPSRLLWLLLVLGIGFVSLQQSDPHVLVNWTLGIVLVSHVLGALGSSSWFSWMAVLAPRRLRGRYFGLRSSAASFTTLLCVPLAGLAVSKWMGGSLQGYGVVLAVGVVAGLVSLTFQFFIVDVNPQVQQGMASSEVAAPAQPASDPLGFLKDWNYLKFLLYFALWMFAVNLSAPFFNLYLLDNLSLDVSLVTLYNSLYSGIHLIMLIVWGKVTDRVGNRSVLIGVGFLVALTPILWLGTGSDSLSLWLWFPLLHILAGATWAAIDLGSNNIQLGIAPVQHQSKYFAVAAAIAGISGALGSTAGGFLAEFANYGGLPGLFALSSVVRLVALLPLVFVHEQRRQSLRQMMLLLFSAKNNVPSEPDVKPAA